MLVGVVVRHMESELTNHDSMHDMAAVTTRCQAVHKFERQGNSGCEVELNGERSSERTNGDNELDGGYGDGITRARRRQTAATYCGQ